ncbi:MAG: hypothetical protein ACLFNQ_14315 [Spirochaetaceae bacterium]
MMMMKNTHTEHAGSRGPKIVVIGAGSYFFGRAVIWNMVHSPVLNSGTLALVDTNEDTLATMSTLARRAVEHAGVSVRVEASTDRTEVLRGADFVVLAFSDRNAHFRGVDCSIAEKYGVRMCSGDTIGPGGIFRALREIPTVLAIAQDCERICPNAWLINYVNPSTVLGIALMRHAGIRTFALCDSLPEPTVRLRYLKMVGILPEDAESVPVEVESKLDFAIAGVNHLTWLLRFVYDGQDQMPKVRAHLAENAALERAEQEARDAGAGGRTDDNTYSKRKFNAVYSLELMDIYGAAPAVIGHTKEYVPFYQGWGVQPVDPEPLKIFDAEDRQRAMDEHMDGNRRYADGTAPIEAFFSSGRGDHATDIIEAMWGGLGKSFYVNTTNRGAVSNMADDAFLELRCDLDMHGPRPQPVGAMPRGIRALQEQTLDTHELTVEAALHCDRDLLLRAFATDPIITNLSDARSMIAELLEAQRDVLDPRWFG